MTDGGSGTVKKVRPAAISSSLEVQDALAQLLAGEAWVDPRGPLRVTTPLRDLNGQGVAQIDEEGVGLVFVDLGPDQEAALALTRALTSRNSSRPVVLLGPSLDSELVLAGMRAGASEYLTQPLDREGLQRAVARLTGRADAGGRTGPGRCIGVLGGKGGSGVTTVATNMAVVLQSVTGLQTLLIDFDDFGTVGILLGLWPRYSFYDVTDNFHRLDHELLTSMIESHESGVDLLSSPVDDARKERLTAEQASRLIRFAKRFYDFVVVDFGRNGAAGLAPAIAELDEAVLVVTPEFPAVRNMKRVISVLEPHFQGQPEDVHLVLNRVTPQANITGAEVATTLGQQIEWTIPEEVASWGHAADVGRPVVLSGGSAKSAKQLRALGTKLAGPQAKSAGDGKGRFRRKLGAFVKRPRA